MKENTFGWSNQTKNRYKNIKRRAIRSYEKQLRRNTKSGTHFWPDWSCWNPYRPYCITVFSKASIKTCFKIGYSDLPF